MRSPPEDLLHLPADGVLLVVAYTERVYSFGWPDVLLRGHTTERRCVNDNQSCDDHLSRVVSCYFSYQGEHL